MYYLKSKDGDGAIFKHSTLTRFYRGYFKGLTGKYQGMKLCTYKKLKTIKNLQKTTYDYCNEVYDIYDENGIVEVGNVEELKDSDDKKNNN